MIMILEPSTEQKADDPRGDDSYDYQGDQATAFIMPEGLDGTFLPQTPNAVSRQVGDKIPLGDPTAILRLLREESQRQRIPTFS